MIEAFGASDIGPVRKNNEDALLCDPDLNIYVVADGMGGAAAGEIASRLAIETICDFVRESRLRSDFTWPFGYDPQRSEAANRLWTALCLANHQIYSVAREYDEYHGMGTTVVCALVSGSQLTVAHAGDSRCYLHTGGVLTLLTEDDSWVAAIERGSGPAAPEAMPSRNVLTNALGVQPEVEIHLLERILNEGELLLLCTDGLHGVVDDPTLSDVLSRGGNLPDIARELVNAAVEHGTADNVTALLMRYYTRTR